MGSFNVGCGISNLAIQQGDDVGFIILTKGTGNERNDPSVGVANFIYGNELFRPYLPPVFGMYGDYGIVEAIEPSKTTEILEAMFSLPVNDIIECITCRRGLYSEGEIFERYFVGSKKFTEFGVSHETALIALGFTKSPSGAREEVYNLGKFDIVVRPYEKQPMLYVWSIWDAEKEETVLVPEFISQSTTHVLEEFSKVSGIFPGYKEEDYAKIQTLKSLYGMYFLKDTFTGMKSHLEKNDYFFPDEKDSLEKMWNEFRNARTLLKVEEPESYKLLLPHLSLGQYIFRYTGFPIASIEELAVYGETYEYLEMPYLSSIMTTLNRMFMPSYCGTQDGDDDASAALNAITNKTLAARRKEYDKYNDED